MAERIVAPLAARAVAESCKRLWVRLKRAGLHPQDSSQPHITPLHDPRIVDPHPIEPMCQTAPRLSLILSHEGLGHREPLSPWQLR